jgi:deoxyribodipyrimidine photo-lyase
VAGTGAAGARHQAIAARPQIVWFRRDLRLADNPALAAAAAGPVVPVFVWCPREEEPWAPGAASRWWLHRSLEALERDLRRRRLRLVVRQGPALEVLRELAAEVDAAGVHWNRLYEPAAERRDRRVKRELRAAGLQASSHNAALLVEPWEVSTAAGEPYRVFTPFWRACMAQLDPPPPEPAPSLQAPERWPDASPIAELGLEPEVDWAGGLAAEWTPGEPGAGERLERFLEQPVARYAAARDLPAVEGTSRLSPHLHFGEIGPRQVWHEIHGRGIQADRYLTELGWREFAHHLLHHFPSTPEQPLRPEFERFPWRDDPDGLRAWQRGRTGFPLVDAGLRQLWETGWMHNRVRMVAASFLVKDLLIPWQQGARWFWDTLVDADLANNTLGWQWTAGCGADAAPFFRVFNPQLQAAKADPDGAYARRWLPELDTPDYPAPIVDHAAARRRALEALRRVKPG